MCSACLVRTSFILNNFQWDSIGGSQDTQDPPGYAPAMTRREIPDVGFSTRNVNCACVIRGFSRQLDLDIVYIVD